MTWNRVGEGKRHGFAHSPGRAWDGIRRNTHHLFAVWLMQWYNEGCPMQGRMVDSLRDWGIRVIDDRGERL